MVIARPKYMEFAHEVRLAQPDLGIGADPTKFLEGAYASVSPAFTVTPNDITITKSENIGQVKLILSVLDGNGSITIMPTGYSAEFENFAHPQIDFVMERTDRLNRNIVKVFSFQDRQYSSVHFGIWYGIDGGIREIERLLSSLTPLIDGLNAEHIGATETWVPSYRRNYINQDEEWFLTVEIEPSDADVNDLFVSMMAFFHPKEPDWSVSEMAKHTLHVCAVMMKAIGIEVSDG